MNMYVYYGISMFMIISGCGRHHNANEYATKLDSPDKLLRAILERSLAGDYEGIKGYIYPAPISPSMNSQDAIVQVMKENRGKGYTGDFSYSDEALEVILHSHINKFSSNITPFWLKPECDGGLLDRRLMEKTSGDPRWFSLLDYKDVHILLVNLDGEYKLLFWEGMNHILSSY